MEIVEGKNGNTAKIFCTLLSPSKKPESVFSLIFLMFCRAEQDSKICAGFEHTPEGHLELPF